MMISHDQQKAIGEECRQAALLYRERGWSPLPLCPPNHIGVGKVHGRNCSSPGKSPLIKWKEHQERIATADEIVEWWKRNCLSNVGIALGPVSGFIRVDAEGETGNRLLEEVCGGDLPETLEFTSGQPGSRGILYRIPKDENDEYIKLRTTSQSGEGDHDELRFQAKGAQTVVPPSRHPAGTTYKWIDRHAPDDIEPAIAPDWLVEKLRVREKKSAGKEIGNPPTTNDRELALLALETLNNERADVYDTWVKVGMILYGIDQSNEMLAVWIEWSRKSAKFNDGECESKWESFGVDDDRDTVGIGSLIYWAQQDGWTLPHNVIDTAQTELALELLQIALDTDGAVGLFQNRTLLQLLADVSTIDHAGYASAKQLVKSAKVGVRDFEKAVKQHIRKKKTDFPQGDAAYFISKESIICHRKETKDGPVSWPLCNFAARIVEQVVYDDGVESRIMLVVEGELFDGTSLKPSTITAEEFSGLNWVLREWGTRPIIYAGAGTKDHLRVALQFLSGDVLHRTVYRHSGWRMVNDQWCYLHCGGAIGAVGALSVEIDGSLKNIIFEAPARNISLQDSIHASLRILKLAPSSVMFSVLSAVYRCILKSSDHGIHLTGPTGTFKSEIASLCQRHFGMGFDARHLPASWSSTANSLEASAFTAKDALLVVDDFCPTGTISDVARMHRDADRLMRAQGNNSGRQRMRPDGTLRPTRPPRGMIMSTGEDVPRGQSLRARLAIIEISPGDVDTSILTDCQRDAADGLYQHAMQKYLEWIAPQYEQILEKFNTQFREVRDTACRNRQHARTPGIVAELYVAFSLFLQFAVESEAISENDKISYEADCWNALLEMADAQEIHQRDAEPTQHFIRLLTAAITSGRAHVAGPGNHEPDEPEKWGWKQKTIGTGQYARDEWQSQGEQIGWVDGDDLFLQPDASFAVVQAIAREQGDSFSVTQRTLHKRMKEKRLLASTDGHRMTVRRTLGGSRRTIIHLHAGLLCPITEPTAPIEPNTPETGEKWRTSVAHFPDTPEKVCHETVPISREKTTFGTDGALGAQMGEETPTRKEF
jgi:hypothetical protein